MFNNSIPGHYTPSGFKEFRVEGLSQGINFNFKLINDICPAGLLTLNRSNEKRKCN